MVRTLIISSETPEEDARAAFAIVKEIEGDAKLEKIVWYSNIGKTLTTISERVTRLEKEFNSFSSAFEHCKLLSPKQYEKIDKLDEAVKNIANLFKERIQ